VVLLQVRVLKVPRERTTFYTGDDLWGGHNLDFEIMKVCMTDYETHNLDYSICGARLAGII
jgi:hypothetical protein